MRRAAGALLLLALAMALGACESNQTRSRRIEEQRRAAAKEASTLDVSRPNPSVTVRRTVLLAGDGGATAVAVELANGGDGQTGVPVLVDAKDGTGKSVYRNDQAGLQESLQRVGGIPAKKTVWWVNDQVLGGASAKTVTAKVGAPRATGDVPAMTFTGVKLDSDADGPYLTGTVTNPSKVPQTLMGISAVAIKGGEVVAAVRGIVPSLPAVGTVPQTFRIVFVGDPRGATYELSAAPAAG